MTQTQRDEIIRLLQDNVIANCFYNDESFVLYDNRKAGSRGVRRCFYLREKSPCFGFYGGAYRVMRNWSDSKIGSLAERLVGWKYYRQNTEDPEGTDAVWFNLEMRNAAGDWYNNRSVVIDVAKELYGKLNECGIFSNQFTADNYVDANTGGHAGDVGMNEKTKEGFRIWMARNGIQEGPGRQYVGYMENHIAQGRCLNVLDDQGAPVGNLDALVTELSANRDDWNTFSQNIKGADNSIDQYKVALGKFIEFAKSVRDGVPPQKPNKAEEQQKEPKEMKPRNLIIFGAPGTGKSHKLEEDRKVFGECYERVTFYPTYSYAQFVGTYKPVMKVAEAAIKSDGLSDDELAERLKEAYDNAGGDSATTKTAAVLLFAEEYYGFLSKTSIPQVIKKAGLPESSYTSWLSSGMALAKAKAQRRVGNEKSTIAYEFVPGPFLRVLVNALNEVPDADGKKKNWCLVIEEINRANAAAVFGDVFQLLDRKDGVSEFAIAASEDVRKFLSGDKGLKEAGKNTLRTLTDSDDLKSLKIPDNMYIWATMNSADQGVFPMDTAFKRRWAFEYRGLDAGAREDGEGNWKIGAKDNKFDYKWEDFRRYVNRLLALAKVNEDKLMGPFFMKKPASGTIDKDEFESKVLMYLWEDAGKMCRRQLFGDISTYSELTDEWEEKGIEIFSSNLRERDTIDKGKVNPKKIRNAKELYKAFEKKTDEGLKQ